MTKNSEAKSKKYGRNSNVIFGVTVSGTPKNELLRKIELICNKKSFEKPYFIVTAYSEFFLEAKTDMLFFKALNKADMVLPDGVSVPAAKDYLQMAKGGWLRRFMTGLRVGGKVLSGDYAGKTVSGVKLVEDLAEIGNRKGWKVFLLGGFGQTAEKLANLWKKKYSGLALQWDRAGDDDAEMELRDKEITDKVAKFEPDVLFVALGRYKQEKWVYRHLSQLRAKVVIGVGSSFDELLGEGVWSEKAPEWITRAGLKWLWRAVRNPKHLKRAWRAFPVFAWRVFRDGNR